MRLFFFIIVFFTNFFARSLHSSDQQKIFFCTGAVSGDYLSAWYCNKLRLEFPNLVGEAIAGPVLEKQGIPLLHHFDDVQASHLTAASGILSRVFGVPSMLRAVNNLVRYLHDNKFTHLVLVDFPFFNLPLARAAKKMIPNLEITYVAPPELWFWRSWGIHYLLKWYCDKIVVLYPFEKDWYKENFDLPVSWVGYPFYDELRACVQEPAGKKKQIALLPGSRSVEIKVNLPVMLSFALAFSRKYPEVEFVLPVADSALLAMIEEHVAAHGMRDKVAIIVGDQEKHRVLSASCLAISKPGTVTLELALLMIPSIVMCRVGWVTYALSHIIVPQQYVSLPNIFLGYEVFKEFFQDDCSVLRLMQEAERLYNSFLNNAEIYHEKIRSLEKLNEQFEQGVAS